MNSITVPCQCNACNDKTAEFVEITDPQHAQWYKLLWCFIYAPGHRPKDVSGTTLKIKTNEYEIWEIDDGH